MRISDWSSDVCSSDLAANDATLATVALRPRLIWGPGDPHLLPGLVARARAGRLRLIDGGDRKSVVEGKSVSVRVDLGGRRIIKNKTYACILLDIYASIRLTQNTTS